jgi:hypothetical protein
MDCIDAHPFFIIAHMRATHLEMNATIERLQEKLRQIEEALAE